MKKESVWPTDAREIGDAANTGIAFGLTKDVFSDWWFHRLLAEDANEFVHVYGGTLEGARFVCALDYLSNVDQRKLGSDIITRAYCLAMDLELQSQTGSVAVSAEGLYREDSVQFLLQRIRLRSSDYAVSKLYGRAVAKINELYDRTAPVLDNDEAAERQMNGLYVADLEERRKHEELALRASTELVKEHNRNLREDTERREKRVIALKLAEGAAKDSQQFALPSPDEAKQFLVMLRESYGIEQFQEILNAVEPKALAEPE